MIHSCFCLILFSILFLSISESNGQVDSSKNSPKAIKSIKSQVYKVRKIRKSLKTDEIEYDYDNYQRDYFEDGRIKRELQYFVEDEEQEIEYIYDVKDSLIKKNIYDISDDDREIKYSYSYEYDNDTLKMVYGLDDDNEVIRIGEYTYYEGNYIVLEYDKDEKEDKSSHILKKYNDKYQEISYENKWNDGKYLEKRLYFYNEDEKLDSINNYYDHKLLFKHIYTYEDSIYTVKLINYQIESEGKVIWTREYNLNEDVISFIQHIGKKTNDKLRYYHYEYDKNGNWIEKKENYNTILYKIVKREIEYYD